MGANGKVWGGSHTRWVAPRRLRLTKHSFDDRGHHRVRPRPPIHIGGERTVNVKLVDRKTRVGHIQPTNLDRAWSSDKPHEELGVCEHEGEQGDSIQTRAGPTTSRQSHDLRRRFTITPSMVCAATSSWLPLATSKHTCAWHQRSHRIH